MPTRASPSPQADQPEAEIDRALSDNHAEVAAKLAAGRAQVEAGQALPLEPLQTLLRAARAKR
jgi:hypothetical protein